jgi:hypothetical protein
MGTGKYAPFRFLCRPEATVLDLVARREGTNHGLAEGDGARAPAAGSAGVP